MTGRLRQSRAWRPGPLMRGAALALALAAPAAASSWTWRDDVFASYNETSGNSRTRSFSAGTTLEVAGPKSYLESSFNALQGQSQGVLAAENFLAWEKARLHWSDENYAFEKLLWKRDRFAGLRYRVDASAGVGRKLFPLPGGDFALETGVGQVLEHHIGEADGRSDTLKADGKLNMASRRGTRLAQEGEYTHNLTDGRYARWRFVTTLTSPLTKRLSIRLSYEYDFSRRVPPGVQRADRIFLISLVGTLGDHDLDFDDDDTGDYGEISNDESAPAPASADGDDAAGGGGSDED